MKNETILLPLSLYAEEINFSLNLKYYQNLNVRKELEEFLKLFVEYELEKRLKSFIRKPNNLNNRVYILKQIAYVYSVYSLDDFIEVVTNNVIYLNLLNLLNTRSHCGEFDTWALQKIKNHYAMIYIGDFRILEWEVDHVWDGVYHNSPRCCSRRNSEETEDFNGYQDSL